MVQVRKTYLRDNRDGRMISCMVSYSQFCPVAKAAEVFGDRWTPIIMRELCFGTRSSASCLMPPR